MSSLKKALVRMLYSSFRPPAIKKRVDLYCEYELGRGSCLRNCDLLVECCDIDFQPCKKSLMFTTHVPHFCENGYVYLTTHANGHANMIVHTKMFLQYKVKLYFVEREREREPMGIAICSKSMLKCMDQMHQFPNLCWRYSFHKMFNLSNDASMNRWD